MGKLGYPEWKKSVKYFLEKFKGPDYIIVEEVLENVYRSYYHNAEMAAWEYIIRTSINPFDI